MTTTELPLIVITGASSGIGAATARAFSAAGYPLLLLARRLEPMLELGLPKAMCCAVDVLQADEFEKALRGAEATYGPADCLINNAGVMMNAPFLEGDPSQWDQMIDINIKGVLNGVRLVLQGMATRQCGTIVNIGSINSFTAPAGSGAYPVSKGAIAQFTRGLASELAPDGVRVNAIAPGIIATAMTEVTLADPKRLDAFLAHVPMKRVGQPEELIGPVVFLCSDAASYVTGAVLPVDGGYLAV